MPDPMGSLCHMGQLCQLTQNMSPSMSGHVGLFLAIPWVSTQPPSLLLPQVTLTTWCLRSSGGASMSWPHT